MEFSVSVSIWKRYLDMLQKGWELPTAHNEAAAFSVEGLSSSPSSLLLSCFSPKFKQVKESERI